MFAESPITSSLALQPEISFTTKGVELQHDNAFAQGTGKFRLNYLEVSLLLTANLTDNFNVHFVLYDAFLLDSKITNESSDGSQNTKDNIDQDDLNKFDHGLAAGIAFDFDSFGIGARYNYGLNKVGKERTVIGQTFTFPDSKNSVWSVYEAIKF